jgi:hypothetical protein
VSAARCACRSADATAADADAISSCESAAKCLPSNYITEVFFFFLVIFSLIVVLKGIAISTKKEREK